MIELHTLGELNVRIPETGARPLLAQPKRCAILTYLVAADITVHRRDTLMAMFWPEHTTARARSALRKALHHIRHVIGDGIIINQGDDAIMLDRTDIRCDATALRSAAAAGRDEVVLQLYRGEFLTGFHLADAPGFETWVERERRLISDRVTASAGRMARSLVHAGRTDEAVASLQIANAIQPFGRDIMSEAIDLLTRSGNRILAIRVYDELARRREDLGDQKGAILAWEQSLRLHDEVQDQFANERASIRSKLTTLRHDKGERTVASADIDVRV